MAAILLVLCVSGAFACCDGECQEDCACSCPCGSVGKCATIQPHVYDYTTTRLGLVTDQSAYLTLIAVADVFRPPNNASV